MKKNEGVHAINAKILQLLPGLEQVYHSADRPDDTEHAGIYPVEFLNSLNPQGMPAHEVRLKVGCPIILLRNIDPNMGLANGTRLIVTAFRQRVIKATIMSGSDAHVGREVLLPRVPLSPSDPQLPIKFARLQFPVRLAFAMSINKAQGQTLSKVGVYLPAPCFSHGQLYVAMSRVGQAAGVKIMVCGTAPGSVPATDVNVVYEEVF